MTIIHSGIDGPPGTPTEDDLPYSDGMPLETERHVHQMNLLAETARRHFAGREDIYVGRDMFVYFSPTQQMTHDFRGPDVFVVTGTVRRERKSWVTWNEQKAPDVVIELLSDSTAHTDRTVKRDIYATRLRVPVYVWYHPFTGEREGFILHCGEYQRIEPDAADRLHVPLLDLCLVRWTGEINDVTATWLRWATPDGTLILTAAEAEAVAAQAAAVERERADIERERAEALAAELARYRERFGALDGGV